ncbi:MAG TPA: hypothetical protein PK264_02680 [Hyphomicrobiaceae bacterium]|nr:hypothetical protein [Hyphomicrobiaceae bacterium]
MPPLDAMSIQPYYTACLAETARMRVAIRSDGEAIVIEARV